LTDEAKISVEEVNLLLPSFLTVEGKISLKKVDIELE
jgi:hypothetical protein